MNEQFVDDRGGEWSVTQTAVLHRRPGNGRLSQFRIELIKSVEIANVGTFRRTPRGVNLITGERGIFYIAFNTPEEARRFYESVEAAIRR
jgi:hypothetical protein